MDQNQINFADDQADDIDQIRGLERFREAVLYGTDWTVGSLLHQIAEGNIDLSPDFQRRDAWSATNKSRFIESVVLQLPIPQIVLAEKKDQKGTFIVLDGKQRLLTLAQFAGSLPDDHQVALEYRRPAPLRLTGLKILSNLNGATYEDMAADIRFSNLKTQFDNHTIRSSLIRNWPDEDYLYEVFIRLNTGSTKLSPQELRQAMKPGRFTEFLSVRSSQSVILQRLLKIDGPDFRMRDVDLLLRMIAFSSRMDSYRGDLKKFLDETHDTLNKEWAGAHIFIRELTNQIEETLGFLSDLFTDAKYVGRRWRDGKYESPVNRAILDAQLAVAMMPANRPILSRIDVPGTFQRMCDTDMNFVESVSGTTKSISSVRTRLIAWKNAIEMEAGSVVELPRLPND